MRIHSLSLLFLLSFAQPLVTNAQEINILDAFKAVKSVGTIDYKTSCAICETLNTEKYPRATYLSVENNKKFEMSVLTEQQANTIFKEIVNLKEMPFEYCIEGSYARALRMSVILDDAKVYTGKAFLEGKINYQSKLFGEVGWSYNVAVMVYVKKDDKLIPYIFEPSMFDKPVPYETWKAKFTENPKTKITSEFANNRYSYIPKDKFEDFTEFKEEDIADADNVNYESASLLKRYKKLKGIKD